MNFFTKCCVFCISILFSVCVTVQATPVGYNDYSIFINDLPTVATILDFESQTYGDAIASGDNLGGITFIYDFGDVNMMVTDDDFGNYPTTSSTNYLGTDDFDIFQDGDDFSLSFSASSSIGLYFISADELYDNDIMLTVGGFTVGLDASSGIDIDPLGTSGRYAYFLGIIDSDASGAFTEASISTIGGGYFTYNIDDIITSSPVPEPTTLTLLGFGLLIISKIRRKSLKSKNVIN